MSFFKLKTDIYLKSAVIITSVIFPFSLYLLSEKKPINITLVIIFSCLYIGTCVYSLFPNNLIKTLKFRLFCDNVLFMYFIVFVNVNLTLWPFLFYTFYIQCFMSFIINNYRFNSNRKLSYYFFASMFLFPLINILINKISVLFIISGYVAAVIIFLIDLLISKLIYELNEKNEEIIKLETEKLNEKTKNIELKEEKISKDREILTLKEEEIRKNEKIAFLSERLKRHEANNLIMRISTRLELMSVELLKAGRKCESEKLNVDIKRLSQMFENKIEVKLFTVVREIKNLMLKRFDNVEIVFVNEHDNKNTKIKPILVQIIFILVENSYEAGAKTVRISTEKESLLISDDGPGFDIKKIRYGYSTKNKNGNGVIGGYGLQTAIDFLELNNIGFDIKSKLNEGTTIKLNNFKNLGIV